MSSSRIVREFHLIDGDKVIKDLGLTSKAWNSIHDHLIDRALQVEPGIHVVISQALIPLISGL
ncbi:MAG TPA: hypothetical protein PKH60_04570 [Candidatus Woesebacteria bacterium]|jgi:hypothetical protein|nr:hypothetical protein [Candidatus Woesebacteria bacterium]